jgi:hypothetical protein
MRTRQFTIEQVAEIRQRWGAGQSAMRIVEAMRLTAAPETVYLTATGRLYSDLNDTVPPIPRDRRKGITNDRLIATITDLTVTAGVPPTIREVQASLGLSSPSSVQFALDRARRLGAVTWTPGKARTLRVVTQ